ncbi:hypothetical protein [Streptomyces sp. NPDC096311]|uniref:hypothetical protein n=1 Tax=Streptomyces sp. NPDC096311 TaxID=3366083 RepID=UPI003827495E
MTTHETDGAYLSHLMVAYHCGVSQEERPMAELIARLESSSRILARVQVGVEERTNGYPYAAVIFDAAGLVKAVRRESEPAGRVASRLFDRIAEDIYSRAQSFYGGVSPLLDLGRAFVRSDDPAA